MVQPQSNGAYVEARRWEPLTRRLPATGSDYVDFLRCPAQTFYEPAQVVWPVGR